MGLVLLGQHAAASFSGPGKISVKNNGAFYGCLDQTMKWVVDRNCGVFTAKTLSSGSRWTSLVLYFMPRGTMTRAWNYFRISVLKDIGHIQQRDIPSRGLANASKVSSPRQLGLAVLLDRSY